MNEPPHRGTQVRRLIRTGRLVVETLTTQGANLAGVAKRRAVGLGAALLGFVVLGGVLLAVGIGVSSTLTSQALALRCAPAEAPASSSANLVEHYNGAAQRYGLGAMGPAVLAAINRAETRFGRNVAVSTAGAVGWMQFLPSTWAQYGVSVDGDEVPDPNSPADAIYSAANYLSALRKRARERGITDDDELWTRVPRGSGDAAGAIWGYNHLESYVDDVWQHAQQYAREGRVVTDDGELLGVLGGGTAGEHGAAPRTGRVVAATVSGTLPADGYAELGGRTEAEANLLGGLPYMTPLLIVNPKTGASVVASKREFGDGEGDKTLDGHRYAIGLSKSTAAKLGIERDGLVEVRTLDGAGPPLPVECCPEAPIHVGSAGTPTLAWPLPGFEPGSRRFGNQLHPIDGIVKFHSGVDVSAPGGTPILAAAAGRVTYAGWHGGHGNYVCVEHNRVLSTCYAHLSRFAVRKDQVVSQGEVVGYVGTTGKSTGNHLHLEVRVDGEYVDPMKHFDVAAAATPSATPAGGCQPSAYASGPTRERIVQIAVSQLGVSEQPPGSNRTPYGPVGAWCAMFTTWVWERAGIPEVRLESNYAVTSLVEWAKQRAIWHEPPAKPEPGDMIVFDGGGWHIALVERVLPDGTITTINGNGGDHMVARRGPSDPASPGQTLGPGRVAGYIKPPGPQA